MNISFSAKEFKAGKIDTTKSNIDLIYLLAIANKDKELSADFKRLISIIDKKANEVD